MLLVGTGERLHYLRLGGGDFFVRTSRVTASVYLLDPYVVACNVYLPIILLGGRDSLAVYLFCIILCSDNHCAPNLINVRVLVAKVKKIKKNYKKKDTRFVKVK